MQRLLCLLGALVVLATPLTSSQAAPPTKATYYLHQTGTCANDGFELFTDQVDSTGDLDGCGAVGAAGAAGGFEVAYSGKQPLGNITLDPTSTAKASIYVTTQTPGPVTVQFSLSAGGASCSGESAEQTVTNTPVIVEYALFEIQCTFTGQAPAKAVPQVTLLIGSQTNYYMGYEDDHASRVELTGLAAAANNTTSPSPSPEPERGLPNVGLATTLALVAAAAVAVAWRRP